MRTVPENIAVKAGPRDRIIAIERAAVVLDDYGQEVSTWAPYDRAWAQVIFGTGQERREAAQENASLAATFRVPFSLRLNEVAPKDRIWFNDYYWDVVSNVPLGRDGLEISAVALVDVKFKRASGIVSGSSSLTGNLAGLAGFGGTVAGASALAGSLSGYAVLSGMLSSIATLSGALAAEASFGGVIAGDGVLSGGLLAEVPAPPAGQVMLTDDDGEPLYLGDQYLTEAA